MNGIFFADIDFNENVNSRIDIYNLSGQSVKPTIQTQTKKGLVQIDTQSLKSGLYIITLNAGDKYVTKKIFVNE
jgi:hypothetical protein